MFPNLADWLESPWTRPPPFMAPLTFRVEEMVKDNRYVIRAELPGLDPEKDIEVAVEGRTLTIHAERRQEDSGPYRSEFRYGSLTRPVRLPVRVDAKDVTVRYEKGVLEVSVPAREVKPLTRPRFRRHAICARRTRQWSCAQNKAGAASRTSPGLPYLTRAAC
jgi:HSP20 family protein